ncbi:aminotransferase class I/II-fold pyridoxal phosphate-dependent enzyme [Luteolibacter algae]|uniref:Aminotransferase class I/II-fold pyridoxal phosphate-dependent enzyme n=1 Tax=Luteolibacter algae TaxID=454151 RepID=A0ABW5DB36_9BACT
MEPTSPRSQLAQLSKQELLRALVPTETLGGERVFRDGRQLWNFASNDYLGLASHPTVATAYIEGIKRFGAGASASRLVTGSSPAHQHLEETLSEAKHAEAALTFTSGFSTALSVIPIVAEKGDFIVLDKLAHASLIDASRISEATLRVFPHNNTAKLAQLLAKIRAKHAGARILVVTESVFSMDGDLCPLREILDLCEEFSALLLLDEAHAIGVLGQTGMGLAEALGVQSRIHFQMGTLSKAVGLSGGYLAADREWIDLIINRARPFIYTTAPPPALLHAASAAIELIRSGEGKALREKLFKNISQLRQGHPSAIIPMILGENRITLDASCALEDAGFLIPAIRFPTVPRNTARLRITVSAGHSLDTVKKLSDQLSQILKG